MEGVNEGRKEELSYELRYFKGTQIGSEDIHGHNEYYYGTIPGQLGVCYSGE
jgi:hypothetical protein